MDTECWLDNTVECTSTSRFDRFVDAGRTNIKRSIWRMEYQHRRQTIARALYSVSNSKQAVEEGEEKNFLR